MIERKGKCATLYVRVSTDQQTTENQERELRQIAERRGWDVVQVYTDNGVSGAKGATLLCISDRPTFSVRRIFLENCSGRFFEAQLAKEH